VLVVNKMDLLREEKDRDEVKRYYETHFRRHRVFFTTSPVLNETTLGDLRECVGLMGTRRFRFIASLKDHGAPKKDEQDKVLKTVLSSLLEHGPPALKTMKIDVNAPFSSFGLTGAEIGQFVISIEEQLAVKIPDRDADAILRGEGCLTQLSDLVVYLRRSKV
jgi:hypothetical protein